MSLGISNVETEKFIEKSSDGVKNVLSEFLLQTISITL